MNFEDDDFKVGLIGEYLVKIRLNSYGVNTGNVDKDTGTDIVLFNGTRILTAQVKSGSKDWNNAAVHGVHLHFKVLLKWVHENVSLDQAVIRWKRIDIPDRDFRELTRASVADIFE